MARIIHDDQGGSHAADSQITVLNADGHETLTLPEGDFISQGDILRDGQDLVLQSTDGHQVVVEGYFAALPAPTLTTPGGSMLTPELVQSFAQSHNQQYAAADTAHDASAIGLIKEISGEATITRVDGTSEKAALGAEIHQGDIIETSGQGAVNIVFLDESSFAISSNARMAIDEYVYDPATQGGETNISILRGMFVFTSGLIGREDPDDVHIETPVGSIGIRGTTIAGNIQPDGQSQITVVEGAIVIKNGHGEVTLSDQYQTVTLNGFEQPISVVGTLDAGEMKDSYGVIGTVAPAFMNTLNIAPDGEDATSGPADDAKSDDAQAGPDAPSDNTPTENAPAESAPAEGEEQGQAEATQPVVAAYDFYNDPLDSGFDQSVAAAPEAPYSTTSGASASLLGTVGLPFLSSNSISFAPTPVQSATTGAGPATLASSEPAAPLPPLEVHLVIQVDDNALAGDIVGRVYTTIAYSNVDISFVNVPLYNNMPVFELVRVAPGVYNVVLTTAGDYALTMMTAGTATTMGVVEVMATLPDGRTTHGSGNAQYGDFNSIITPVTPTVPPLNLTTITGTDGQLHLGSGGNGLGSQAAYLGDFNNDGTPDYALAYDNANLLSVGLGSYTTSGSSVQIAGNGDLNGDGYLDIIVGSPYTAGNTGYIALYNGYNLATGSAQNGLTGSLRGSSVAMVDFNGDGYADAFYGQPGAASGEGSVSMIQGATGLYFNGPTTFTFADATTGGYTDMLGLSMTGLRDYNNDGYGDLAVGQMLDATTGQVTIYTGNNLGVASGMITLTINNIANFDMPLFDLGDLNGDGRSDLMIGQTGYNANSDPLIEGRLLISMGGSNTTGYSITAAEGSQFVGAGNAGDFNGDGFSDIFVATRTGSMVDAYVLYGSSSFSSVVLDSTWLQNNQGSYMHMTMDLNSWGMPPPDATFSSTSIGDQNGDGYQDLLISTSEVNGGNGAYFVVYGRADAQGTQTGYIGSAGNNTASNQITAFTSIYGGNGDDSIRLYASNSNALHILDGGHGHDRVALADGNINLSNISQLAGIEEFAFEGASAQTLTLGLNDVFSLLQTTNLQMDAGFGNKFTVLFGEANDSNPHTLNVTSNGAVSGLVNAGFTNAGTYTDAGSNTYNVFTHGSGYQLLIDADITVTV